MTYSRFSRKVPFFTKFLANSALPMVNVQGFIFLTFSILSSDPMLPARQTGCFAPFTKSAQN